ncbi:L-rhamnose mutarotase [Muricomes intestini]|nr:L-rhamnose mutarotase [Muricomes intestini]
MNEKRRAVRMKRCGEMIRIKPEGLEKYKEYHANPLPGVNEMIKECNIQNYSIYQRGDFMFSYYEYIGENYKEDMAKMASDPATQKWWDLVKPLMQPLEDKEKDKFWSVMQEIYHLD